MKKDFYEKLCEVVEKELIFRNEPMSRHTTVRTGGPAEVLVTPAAEELEQEIKAIIAAVGATSAKDMGKVMGTATKQLAGKADGKAISALVKQLLA